MITDKAALRVAFQERCSKFGARIVRISVQLMKSGNSRFVADQLMRSGTSVGANAQEAQAAQSRADFVHKMQIALKEAKEAVYWLGIAENILSSKNEEIPSLKSEAHQIAAILARSIITAKANARRQA